MKRLLRVILLLSLLVPILLVTPLYAQQMSYISDDVGLLTDTQWQQLETRAANLTAKYQCEIRIIIVEDMRNFGYTNIEKFSAWLYEEHKLGYGSERSLVLLTQSVNDRDLDLCVWGYGNYAFTLYGIDHVWENYLIPQLKRDNYYAAYTQLFDRAEIYFQMAATKKPFDKNTDPAVIAERRNYALVANLLVPLLVAFTVTAVWKGQMKTANIAKSAQNYIPQGGVNLTRSEDIFLFRTRSSRTIQTSSSSSGGGGASSRGGGSSGRSGKY